jgi:hypothetical protein
MTRLATPLFNREAELGEIQAAIDGAAAGSGGLFLIAGEPGAGKTLLAEAAADRAAAAGMLQLWGRCWENPGAPAFWPWRQPLRTLVRSRDDEQLRSELGGGAAWVAHIVPELRERLPDVERPGSLESDQARFAMFDAIGSFLRNASAAAPLLIVLDDVHAADHTSLLLLEFLARTLQDEPILVLATYQPAVAQRRAEMRELVGALGRQGREVLLRGLGTDTLAEMLEHRTGVTVAGELVRALHETTGGNPLFASEVMRLLAAEGQLELWAAGELRARFPLPENVRETIRRRFEPLGEEALRALETAAVIGREFQFATLLHATGAERDRLIELLDEALRPGLIVDVPGGVGRFRFAHGLIREALYGELGGVRRIDLHRAVGEAIEATSGVVPDRLPELAHHFVEASPGGDVARAVEYSMRAGRHAMEVLAYEHAAELFELALSTSELMTPDAGLHAELLVALGYARVHSADNATARQTLLDAAAAARAAERPDLLAEAALGVRAFAALPGRVDDAHVGLLDEALERLDEGDSALRARLLARLAVALYYRPGTSERREALVQDAIAMSRRVGSTSALAYALGNGQMATWGPDSAQRALTWGDELLGLTEEAGDAELALAARNRQIDLLLELGDLSGADIAIELLDGIAHDNPDPRARAYVPMQRARRAVIDGDWEAADRLGAEAAAVGERLRDANISMLTAAGVFGQRWLQGRLGEVEEATRRFADTLAGAPAWRAGLTLVYCELGRDAEARREFERLAAHDFADVPRVDTWLAAMALLSEACAHLGDAARAETLYELLDPFADRNVVTLHAVFAGPVSRYLAILAAARGDDENAAGHFAAARVAAERFNARPILALVGIDEASTMTSRDPARALELLADAEKVAREIGADALLGRIDELRGEMGENGDRPAAAAAPAPAGGPASASLRREGDMWTFEYEGRAVGVRDTRGMHHLAALLSNPGVELHALELAGGTGESGGTAARAAAEAGLEVRASAQEEAGAVLDAEAKQAYRQRLEDLRAELEEAEEFNDPERAARAREEIDFLGRELAGAVGLGGRDRPVGASAERARVNVTRAIRSAIKRVADHDAPLGQELEATVRTGTFCAFEPDVRRPVSWSVDA